MFVKVTDKVSSLLMQTNSFDIRINNNRGRKGSIGTKDSVTGKTEGKEDRGCYKKQETKGQRAKQNRGGGED